ncbi:hypothetical protein MQP27_05645 [Streptomyces sp. 7R015]|uniref:Uncharacterized protein n=2 Tax=Streptomyces TaxID=1883 RepID=A0ABS9Y050_9ACTN|nr:hypothetical protein [Streptomyces cylindrosporus]
MTPEEGMRAHLDLQGGQPHGVMMPIHWATFNLATHPWAEPGEGTVAAARATGSRIAVPRPGEPFEPTAETVPTDPWWRAVAQAPKGGWPAVEAVQDAVAETVVGIESVQAQGKTAEGTGTGEPETVSAG